MLTLLTTMVLVMSMMSKSCYIISQQDESVQQKIENVRSHVHKCSCFARDV